MLSGKSFAELIHDARKAKGFLLIDATGFELFPVSVHSENEYSHKMTKKDQETLRRTAKILGVEQAKLVQIVHLAQQAKSDVIFSRVLSKKTLLAEAMFHLSDSTDDRVIEQALLKSAKEVALCTA